MLGCEALTKTGFTFFSDPSADFVYKADTCVIGSHCIIGDFLNASDHSLDRSFGCGPYQPVLGLADSERKTFSAGTEMSLLHRSGSLKRDPERPEEVCQFQRQ